MPSSTPPSPTVSCSDGTTTSRSASAVSVGVLGGTGPAGSALAVRLASVGYAAVIGSRDPDRAADCRDRLITASPGCGQILRAGDNAAAADCDVVVVATPWQSAASVAQQYRRHLEEKVVISMGNALTRVASQYQPATPSGGSVAAELQAVLPDSKVVAAFNHLPARELAAVQRPIDCDVLLCGDDPAAITTVAEITSRIPGCRPLVVGPLCLAGAIESFTAVLMQVNAVHRVRATLRVVGVEP